MMVKWNGEPHEKLKLRISQLARPLTRGRGRPTKSSGSKHRHTPLLETSSSLSQTHFLFSYLKKPTQRNSETHFMLLTNTSVNQEPNALVLDLASKTTRFSFDSCRLHLKSDTSLLSNFVHFNTTTTTTAVTKRTVSLKLPPATGASGGFRNLLNEFNRFVRFHCEKIPIGFASLRVGNNNNNSSTSNNENGSGDGVRGEEGCGVVEDERMQLNGAEAENPKKILILMSDTGGGHRASAEAIKSAFHEEFGDDYQVFVTDLWSDHTPWPFNQLPRSYSFLVKHGPLWKMTYYGTAPRVVHQSNFAATSTFIAREVAKGIMKYQPDIIISVHPLMQHVPLRILRAKGLLKKIVFTTVVTDLSTCHPTWFHKLVTRCYCPTTEVAKRAIKAGLQQSRIKLYGLPVRPSFVKPIRSKDELRRELGMDEDLPAVLLMGGGEGMGPIEATALALGDSLNDENLGTPIGQILVICGRNKKLANKLNSIKWKIPVQESGNVPYVVENGCGKFSKSPKEIAKIVAEWFGPKADELKIMSQNALRLARPDAVFKIVHDLHELARQRSLQPEYSCTA